MIEHPNLHEGSSPRVRGTRVQNGLDHGRRGIIPACAGNTTAARPRTSQMWDHPRVCGEHQSFHVSPAYTEGSSPRVRGTLEVHVGRPTVTGIIPACAGNTSQASARYDATWDHPRVCGEHAGEILDKLRKWGSSPRVRGTRQKMVPSRVNGRIIPACAGNTPRHRPAHSALNARDHPRVCGEHREGAEDAGHRQGSSPRVRGTPAGLPCTRPISGIIPACAGNTIRSACAPLHRWDHPRVCGEHEMLVTDGSGKQGSSPRVRGTRLLAIVQSGVTGIIPACAGNTHRRRSRPDGAGDHPRVCGEHSELLFLPGGIGGSSPRVRGTPASCYRAESCKGIIPACAGNTSLPPINNQSMWDHPRVCGEHSSWTADVVQQMGSSPRARGTLLQLAEHGP